MRVRTAFFMVLIVFLPGRKKNEPTNSAPPFLSVSPTSLSFTDTIGGYYIGDVAEKAIHITNSGGGALSWTATIHGNWLKFSAESTGTAPSDLYIVPDWQRSLPSGTYSASLVLSASAAANSPVTVPINYVIIQPVYDGSWSGLTSQGKNIRFTIANNVITSDSIGFALSGCGQGVTSFLSGSSVALGGISGTTFYNVNHPLPEPTSLEVNFFFTLEFSVSGQFKFGRAECTPTSATWSATRQ